MLTYTAIYKFLDDGVHAEVLDFPGAISCGEDIDNAREMLAGALVDLAETCLSRGESLPQPDPSVFSAEADLQEPIHLLLTAASHVALVPQAISP